MLELRHGVWVMQMGQYYKMFDMHQIGLMIGALLVSRPEPLNTFVDFLVKKQLSASAALQQQWKGQVHWMSCVTVHDIDRQAYNIYSANGH